MTIAVASNLTLHIAPSLDGRSSSKIAYLCLVFSEESESAFVCIMLAVSADPGYWAALRGEPRQWEVLVHSPGYCCAGLQYFLLNN